MTEYKPAPEVEAIATQLMEDVEQHKPLRDVRVDYVWRDKASKSKGRLVLAKARKVTGLSAFLANAAEHAEPLFVIEVAADTWARLDEKQRVALVDHELCHCRVDEDGDGTPCLSTRGHDLEEFACIVERHGLWASDVANFGSVVAEQLALAVEEVARFVEGLDDEPPPEGAA